MTSPPAVRLGLVGVGPWGRNYIPTVAGTADATLSVVASRRQETRRLLPDGCRLVADWREMLDCSLIEGVIIATPAPLHREMVLAALDADLPVLVEKPLTLDLDDAHVISERATERGSIVVVDHIYLFHEAYRELRRRVQGRGGILSLAAVGGGNGPFRVDTPPVWDYGTHYVAICLDLLGADPRSATTRVIDRDSRGELAAIELRFPGGETAELIVGNLLKKKTRRFSVSGQDWAITFDDLAQHSLVEEVGGKESVIDVLVEPPLRRVVREFVAAIRSGTPALESLDLAVRTVAVLQASTPL